MGRVSTGLSIAQVQALPASVDLATAGRAIGIGRSTAFDLVKKDEFPLELFRVGKQWKCRKTDICSLLNVTPEPNTPTAQQVS